MPFDFGDLLGEKRGHEFLAGAGQADFGPLRRHYDFAQSAFKRVPG